jgi:hypothetical protein
VAQAEIRLRDATLVATGTGTLFYVPMPLEDADLLDALGR